VATVDWSELTTDQVKALVSAANVKTTTGADGLLSNLSFAQDLTKALDVSTASVEWDGASTIHRICRNLGLLTRLNWGTDLVRLYQTLTDPVSGLSAKRNIGVFTQARPDQQLGVSPTTYQVAGQDRIYFLTRQVGYSYVIPAGSDVLTALGQVFTDAGIAASTVLIDGSAAGSTTPTDMVWPLIATSDASSAGGEQTTTSDSGTTTDDASGPTTWLQIINRLCGLIAYRGVWCDESGFYRLGPYADPGDRSPTFTFDATARASLVSVNRVVSRPVAGFNRWIFINSTLPDVDGVPAVPAIGAGIYQVDNTDDGPGSINALGGDPFGVWPTQISFAAADQASLEAQGNLRVAADKRVPASAKVATARYPAASHYDIFTWIDDGLDEGQWIVEATSWQMPLKGAEMTWAFTKVG
jgi:hypothetical protein